MPEDTGGSPPVVAEEATLVASLIARGARCTKTRLSIRVEYCGEKFFIPRALADGGYTQAQLEYIELWLQFYGLDLLPLDRNLH